MRLQGIALMVVAAAAAVSCRSELAGSRDRGAALAVVGESTRLRLDEPLPRTTPWFTGSQVALVAARGETLGLQIAQRAPGPVSLSIAAPGVSVRAFTVDAFAVVRPSTAMFGGSRGRGRYADGLTAVAAGEAAGEVVYLEVAVAADALPGDHLGVLRTGDRATPVVLRISPVVLPPLPLRAWAYADPRELASTATAPTAGERACIAMFRAHGVLLSPDLPLAAWPARRELVAGLGFVPVSIPREPAAAADAVRGWIAATAGTGSVPFAIPIDEPRTPAAQAEVRTLAAAVRAAGGGPGRFLYAVTAEPGPALGPDIDLWIGLRTAHLAGDPVARWTYNGAPPTAGNMTLDAHTPGTRTWGWIGWRWQIPVWYVWDALYWRDRHNTKQPLDPARDPVSFDDGDDRGNLDGVLALPAGASCRPTLRLAALRRGLQDRSLLELAARCDPRATAALAASLVPTALGDAPRTGGPSWPTDEAAWELARQQLLALAACNAR